MVAPALAAWWAYAWLRQVAEHPLGFAATAWWIVAGAWFLGWIGHIVIMGGAQEIKNVLVLAGRALIDQPLQVILLLPFTTSLTGAYTGTVLPLWAVTIGLPLLARRDRKASGISQADAACDDSHRGMRSESDRVGESHVPRKRITRSSTVGT